MTAADRALGEVDLSGQADQGGGGFSLGMRHGLAPMLVRSIFVPFLKSPGRCGGVAAVRPDRQPPRPAETFHTQQRSEHG